MFVRKSVYSLIVLGAAFAARPAHAHFLWVEVSDETPATAKLFFAEGADGISTDVPVEKIETARAWALGAGKPQVLALQTGGGVRQAKVGTSHLVGASQTWGVLDKSAEGRGVFKLEYWAKASATLADASKQANLPFEMFAQADGARSVRVSLQHDSKPVPATTIYWQEPGDDKPHTITTDAKGEARFDVAQPGTYGLRANWNDEKPGKLDGKKYDLTRHYTTLTFHIAAAGATAAPVVETSAAKMDAAKPDAVKTAVAPANAANSGAGVTPVAAELPPGPNPKADLQAYALLKAAHDNRQVMPDDFPGFTAKITYNKDGKASTGTITYRRQGKTDILFPTITGDEKDWLDDKIMNIVGHRRGGSFAEGDGRNPLVFSKEPENSFGKLIELNDGMQSSYRVRDNHVTEVTRTAGNSRFTISVVETMETDAGRYLANHFMVSYRDAKTGALQMVEGYRDSYAKLDGVWLPVMRTVITIGDSTTPTMQSIRFSDIKKLEPQKMASAQ